MHDAMKGNRHTKVALHTLNNGEAVEKFHLAHQQILADLVDPNKNPDDERSITLTVKYKAKKKRDNRRYGDVDVVIGCKAKLGSFFDNEGSMVLTEGEDGPEAYQDAYRQTDLDSAFSNRNNGRAKETS